MDLSDVIRIVELGDIARERPLTLNEEGEVDYLSHRISKWLSNEETS